MAVAVIDYDMGNLGSVLKALKFLGTDVVVAETPAELEGCERIILPGVGNFGDGMAQLRARKFDQALREVVGTGKLVFGICLGMQMLLEGSEEAPGVAGLGIFPGICRKFDSTVAKVPQIGWNTVRFVPGFALGAGLGEGENWFYFVHSFYVPAGDYTAGTAEYTLRFSAAIAGKGFFATQFHPEKSRDAGLTLLRNFLAFPVVAR